MRCCHFFRKVELTFCNMIFKNIARMNFSQYEKVNFILRKINYNLLNLNN